MKLRILGAQTSAIAIVPGLTQRAALLLLALLLAPRAGAAEWLSCTAPGVTPPKPVERTAPPYPPAAREIGVEGYVEVALTVLVDGRVGWVRVLRAEPGGFFESAVLDHVRSWRFTPAFRDFRPAECRIETRLRFRLEDADAPSGTTPPPSPPPPREEERPAAPRRGPPPARVS